MASKVLAKCVCSRHSWTQKWDPEVKCWSRLGSCLLTWGRSSLCYQTMLSHTVQHHIWIIFFTANCVICLPNCFCREGILWQGGPLETGGDRQTSHWGKNKLTGVSIASAEFLFPFVRFYYICSQANNCKESLFHVHLCAVFFFLQMDMLKKKNNKNKKPTVKL